MTRSIIVFVLLAVGQAVWAAAPPTKPMRAAKPIDGREAPVFAPNAEASRYYPPRRTLDETIGDYYVGGTTWYDFQHNGTTGKMIDVDDAGFVHITWTNGLNNGSTLRHVYYNIWDPATQAFTISNGQVDGASRSGYVTGVGLGNGFFFPSFHQEIVNNGTAHTAAAIDLLARAGAYTSFEPSYLFEENIEMEIIWPKIAKDRNGLLHAVSTENPASGQAGDPQRIYYSRGLPVIADEFGMEIVWQPVDGTHEFRMLDTVMVISPDIACSRTSDRVVIAWSDSRDDLADNPTQYNNDIYYIVSDDGGDTWSDRVNISNFIPPDLDCASGDTLICDQDTFRTYTDLSVILDNDDDIHIAFTTRMYYALEGTISRYASQIWHWSSDSGYVSPIFAHTAAYFDSNWADDLGDWQTTLQRPNLAIDDETGELYCCFVRADSANWSEGGVPMQDVWIAKSWDDGVAWTMARNVTNTNTGQFVPPGESMHERDASLATLVTESNGAKYLHLFYVLDLDAGGAVGTNPTGVPTLNPVHYQRVPVDSLPNMPLWRNDWPVFHVDSTDMPPLVTSSVREPRPAAPEAFALYQNYPNPFNPSTYIQFDLAQASRVNLRVYNVAGQEVARLFDNAILDAGVQRVEFNGSALASGVYLYQLETGGLTQTRKMVLLK